VLASPELQNLGKGTALKVYADNVGYSETIGAREKMEDALVLLSRAKWRLYAVLDGHGGPQTSQFVSRYFARVMTSVKFSAFSDIETVCTRLQQILFKKHVSAGAAFAAVILAKRQLCVAHLGATRVLRVLRNGNVIQLTSDHKACERREMELIKSNKSFVSDGRVEGQAPVSRSLGDFAISGIVRTPEVQILTLGEDDSRLVIACESVFDVLDNEVVGRIVTQEPDIHKAAAIVKYVTLASRSIENISVVVVDVTETKRSGKRRVPSNGSAGSLPEAPGGLEPT
jgi:serine/threonine protein phosphatase PrpC